MKTFKIGVHVKTKVEQLCLGVDGKETIIPVGTNGLVCEAYDDHVEVEIWGENSPKNVVGVFGYALDEVEIIH